MDTDWVATGVLRVAFAGVAGVGSEGNDHGNQIGSTLHECIEKHHAKGLVIDLSKLDYSFGDWIGVCFWQPLRSGVRLGCSCIVAHGHTAECIRDLWKMSNINKMPPIVATIDDAVTLIKASLIAPDAGPTPPGRKAGSPS